MFIDVCFYTRSQSWFIYWWISSFNVEVFCYVLLFVGGLALPKLNLQFLTLHDYLLRNFHLFRMESTCKTLVLNLTNYYMTFMCFGYHIFHYLPQVCWFIWVVQQFCLLIIGKEILCFRLVHCDVSFAVNFLTDNCTAESVWNNCIIIRMTLSLPNVKYILTLMWNRYAVLLRGSWKGLNMLCILHIVCVFQMKFDRT